jgi:hypothetical protein
LRSCKLGLADLLFVARNLRPVRCLVRPDVGLGAPEHQDPRQALQ